MLNENFKTTLKENRTDVDILFAKYDIATQLNIKEEQIESVEINDLTIDWNLYLEIRSWGVKTISVFAYNVFTYLHADDDDVEAKDIVTLNVEYYKTNDEDAELIEGEVEIDVSEFEVESNVDEDVENRNMYFPTNVEIDFRSKQITVTI